MMQPNSIVIPGYRILRKLGQGGMATVYLAIQESFDREVALKIMSPFLNSDPSFTTRFVREARIVAQIHHASIVPVMDVGEYQTHHYLSMEYLPGGDLKHRIADGKHGLSLAVNVCLAISGALDVAHRKGFVHRDIKPENILFREDGTPVLTDFGIARAIDAGTSLTMAGMMVGTPNYMSPEQVKGHELDGRSDLYSLGIVFYETLTGNVPFRADSTMSLALKHLSDPLPPLPPEFALYQPFIDRLTAKDREDRFASGAEVARALRLINDMANPRANPALRTVLSPTLPPVVSPTVSSSLPQQGEGYAPTLLAPRSATPVPTLSIPANPELPPTATPVPQVPATAPAKVATPQLPKQPSKLAAALAAVGPALVSSLANAARGIQSAAARGWVKLRSLKFPVRPPAAVSTPPLTEAAPANARSSLASHVQKFAAVLRTRPAVWATVGIVTVALASGAYLLLHTEAPTQQAKVIPPAPAPVSTTVPEPASTPIPEPVPIEAQPVPVTAPDVPEISAEELVALLTRITKERATRTRVATLFRRAGARVERETIEARRKAEDEQRRLANETRIKQLLSDAKSAIADGRSYLPVGSSAVDCYIQALAIDPKHPEALAAKQKMVELLVTESERHIKFAKTSEAGALIARLRALEPQNARLTSLEMLLASRPAELNRREGSRLRSSTKTIGKANDELNKKRLSFRELDVASDAYKDAAQELPESPGLELLRERIVVTFAAAYQAQVGGDMKEANRLLEMARKRGLAGPELERAAAQVNGTNKR